MILSRANLIAGEVARYDKGGMVHVREDGSTGATGRRVVVIVGPVPEGVRQSVGRFLGDGERSREGVGAYTAETIGEVLKNVPRDRQFGGLLEHVAVDDEGEWTVTDGKRKRSIKSAKRSGLDPYPSIFKEIGKAEVVGKCVVNRKRLIALLGAMDKALTDGEGGSSPVWLDFHADGTIVIRGVDAKTGQRMIGAVVATIGEGAQLPEDEFEKGLGMWSSIISELCDKCGNHLRRLADGRKECSYGPCREGVGTTGREVTEGKNGPVGRVIKKGPPPRKKVR